MLRYMGALGILCLLSAGCVNPQVRAQMEEESDKERDLDVRTIGDVTVIDNAGLMKVQNVGLVTGLAGTGHCPPGAYRNLLEQYLLKSIGAPGGEIAEDSYKHKVRQLLENPDNCLVIVTGYIPPGARRGDRFDAEITLPHGSKATSLAGGFLQLSVLRVYEAAANLSEKHANSSQLLPGQISAHAKGPLMVGFGSDTDSSELKHARVWQGGVARTDRPYSFFMLNDKKSSRISAGIADRMNNMYQEDPRSKALMSEQQKQIIVNGLVTDQLNGRTNATGLVQTEMAKAVNKEAISVRVPFAYRHNHARYMRVARFTPITDTDPGLPRYKQRLKKMLHDPRDTVRAALRFEAMGRGSIEVLKEGLDSDHALVRFASAEALAYLGSTAGVEMLTRLAQEHPLFADHACLALANLGENTCRDRLGQLLSSGEPAVRTAAFHGLSLLDETDTRLGGQNVNGTFWLHRLPQSPASMVCFASSKKAQVICYGRNIRVLPDARLFVGRDKDFTIVTDIAEDKCLIKRYAQSEQRTSTPRSDEVQQRVCSQRLDEILLSMADLGATYPDLVEFLRKAHDYRKLNCPVTALTHPEITLETLIERGRDLR